MRKKVFTGAVTASVICYIFVLGNMLFFQSGRVPVLLSEHMKLKYDFCLIPFKTITEYITAIVEGSARGHAIRNLAGNLLLLLPLGFFLPFFIRKTAKIMIYTVVVTVIILAIEVAQLITFTGSLDIDDFILNLSGALLGFAMCKHTPIRHLFRLCAY